MKQPEILEEIARIEGELARLAGELRSLRERLAMAPGNDRRHTLSFSAPPPPIAAAPASHRTPAIPPPPRSRTRGRSEAPPLS